MNSTLLADAADVIARQGLTTDEYYELVYEDADGKEVPVDEINGRIHFRRSPRKCPVCPRGAIAVAAGADPAFMPDFDHIDEPRPQERAIAATIESAERALVEHLISTAAWVPAEPGDRRPEVIEEWADAPGRTQEQVLEALRGCAENERAAGR